MPRLEHRAPQASTDLTERLDWHGVQVFHLDRKTVILKPDSWQEIVCGLMPIDSFD